MEPPSLTGAAYHATVFMERPTAFVVYLLVAMTATAGAGAAQIKGFVSRQYVRSPVGWRAVFSRKDGVWRLVTFVAGD